MNTENKSNQLKRISGWLFFAGALLALCLVMSFTSGCVSTKTVTSVTDTNGFTTFTTNVTRTLDTNEAISLIEAAVPPAVEMVCQKDKNASAYFQQAQLVIRAAAANGQYDVATITNSLSKISIRELRSQNAVMAEEAALSLYQAFAAQAVTQQLDKVVWLRPVLLAVADAIKSGVDLAGP
jgi:hypothetical protein